MPDALADREQAVPASTPAERDTAPRPPPKAIKCIVPVWGYKFVHQFLELGLPTWLAPGNIPALAAALPCEFIILTSADDEPFLRQHPAFQRLRGVCAVAIRRIDHLITGTNYSTTITLAYAEAVRAEGTAMLDTCFFFLVSDYIAADGSFGNALAGIVRGASGILAGNFQVSLEDALPWLEDQLAKSPGVLSLTPRQMMRWALSHLHPVTVANVVNYPLSSNLRTNRLFWRVDGETLLGRFFLMHMLCIRPELTDFVVGSSCDYSFIPEMCPSGNVELIGDSDEYLVVEMQPREHEARFLRSGPLDPRRLAKSLSEWTTARHRENSRHSVVFHAGDIPWERLARTEAAVESLLAKLRQGMSRHPKPHRHHPYWRGAIAAHREAMGQRLTRDEWRRVLGIADPSDDDGWLSAHLIDRIRFALFGRPPFVRRWHPRWPDFSAVLAELSAFLDDPRGRLLMISDGPTVFTASLADGGERAVRVRLTPFLESQAEAYRPMAERFDVCLLELGEGECVRADELIDRVASMMKPAGKIVLVIYNRRETDALEFFDSIAFHSPRLLRPSAAVPRVRFVRASRFRSVLMRAMTAVARMASGPSLLGVPLLLAAGSVLAPACFVANTVDQLAARSKTRRGRRATSLVMTLDIDGALARDVHKYSSSRLLRREDGPRFDASDGALPPEASRSLPMSEPSAGQVSAPAPDAEAGLPGISEGARQVSMRSRAIEPQYNRCIALRERHGLTSLGIMTNQVYYDDPRRLAILLARYKFVAKMLSGRRNVAEVGCGDAFGTRIVMQETGRVVGYDIDRIFVEDIRERQYDRWPVEAHVHDIVLAPLPDRYDGIYSLDVIEHIRRANEHAYLSNLRGSLTANGVLIIGTPSLESQAYASPSSKTGHVNCKTGEELRRLLQQYFENVFVFSMNDEVVHTGFYPMAHYLLALCCASK